MKKYFVIVIAVMVGAVMLSTTPAFAKKCGNRNTNPRWSFGQKTEGGVRVFYGQIKKAGGPWIQSKWFDAKEAQVVVTNWDGKFDITERLAAAKAEARRTERRIRSGELPADCGQKHCYVCEF